MSGPPLDEGMSVVFEPDERERLRRRRAFAYALAEASGAKEEFVAWGQRQGEAKTLTYLLSRKLNRALSLEEAQAFSAKLSALGAQRLSDVLWDLPAPELLAWLKDPKAS